MERAEDGTSLRTVSSLGMVMAVVTFLAMWGGLTLLLSDPHGLHLPPLVSTPRGTVTSLLLFWIPAVTGSLACLAGLAGLASRGRGADVQRRALVVILLGLAPVCLAATWLAWVLANP